jgi:hypothetical protein
MLHPDLNLPFQAGLASLIPLTIHDTDDTPDGIERTAVLKGKRLDLKEGRRVTVTGTLRVIDLPARRIGQVVVLPRSEIRV